MITKGESHTMSLQVVSRIQIATNLREDVKTFTCTCVCLIKKLKFLQFRGEGGQRGCQFVYQIFWNQNTVSRKFYRNHEMCRSCYFIEIQTTCMSRIDHFGRLNRINLGQLRSPASLVLLTEDSEIYLILTFIVENIK